ncbi:MAG: phosphoesterase [Myxococcota bacterium]
MLVHVLHHARCFDGAASAALFCAFFRRHRDAGARFVLIPKAHRTGDPFDPADFEADEVACVDFRYSRDPRLTWWFDHHRSAFALPGQQEHFEADRSGQKFYDPQAPSCTGLIARVTAERFGFDSRSHQQLVQWAEIIDSAAFPDPATAVHLKSAALRLMTFAEHNDDPTLLPRFIDDLLTRPFDRIVRADYVQRTIEPVLEQQRLDIELIGRRARVRQGVLELDLLDQPGRAYNKFIAYYHHPQVQYVVSASVGPRGNATLTAGYNPWCPADQRAHDLAALCERFGGGGHPFVGGVTFEPGQEDRARSAAAWIADALRRPPSVDPT